MELTGEDHLQFGDVRVRGYGHRQGAVQYSSDAFRCRRQNRRKGRIPMNFLIAIVDDDESYRAATTDQVRLPRGATF
jgi:hypothetical protein